MAILLLAAPSLSAQSLPGDRGLSVLSGPALRVPTATQQRIPLYHSTRARGGALVGMIAGSIFGGALLHFGIDATTGSGPGNAIPFTKRPNSELDPGSIPMSVVGLFVGALIGDRIPGKRRATFDMNIGNVYYAHTDPGIGIPASGGLRLIIQIDR